MVCHVGDCKQVVRIRRIIVFCIASILDARYASPIIVGIGVGRSIVIRDGRNTAILAVRSECDHIVLGIVLIANSSLLDYFTKNIECCRFFMVLGVLLRIDNLLVVSNYLYSIVGIGGCLSTLRAGKKTSQLIICICVNRLIRSCSNRCACYSSCFVICICLLHSICSTRCNRFLDYASQYIVFSGLYTTIAIYALN